MENFFFKWTNMFILYITCRYSHFNILCSSPCQKQCGLLASVVCCLSFVNFSHFNLLLWNPSAKWTIFIHRGHSIDAFCHVSVNLAKRFQRRRFKQIGQSETRIACGGPCLVMDHNKMHGHHRQFLFLIGRYLKNLLLLNCLAKWTETW
jgi:hypothetical protein